MHKKLVLAALLVILSQLTLAVPTVSAAAADLEITLPRPVSVCPCTTATANDIQAFVTNSGNFVDTFTVSLILPNQEDWSGFLAVTEENVNPREVTLSPGETRRIEVVYVTPSCLIDSGNYSVRIAVRSQSTGEEISRAFNVEVLKCRYLDLETERYKETCKGVPVTYEMNATNYGKFDERFSLSASVDWAKFTPESVKIVSQETIDILLTLEPPEGLSGLQDVSVTMSSQEPYSYASDTENLQLNVQECFEFDAALQPGEQSTCVDTPATYVLVLSNTGIREDTFTITAPSWVELEQTEVTVGPGQRREVVLSATSSQEGRQSFEVTATSSSGVEKTVTGVLNTEDCSGVVVTVSPSRVDVCRGEAASYTVTVKNTGTTRDVFTLTTPYGVLGKNKLVLDPEEEETLKLTIDTTDLAEIRSVAVRASSDRAVDEGKANLIVEKCYDAEIILEPETLYICPCDEAEYNLTLWNRGKFPDNYTLMFGDYRKNIYLDAPPDHEHHYFTFPVACDRGAGKYVTLASAESEHIIVSANATMIVKPPEECYIIELSTDSTTQDVEDNNATVYKIRATNTGELNDTFELFINGPVWSYLSHEQLELAVNETSNIYVYASPPIGTPSGYYQVRIVARSQRAQSTLDLITHVISNVSGGPPLTNESVVINASLPTGAAVAAEPEISFWRMVTVGIIALIIVVILVTRFIFLLK